MRSLFHSRARELAPVVEPVQGQFPKVEDAEIAAAFYGKRVAGDLYDSLRVSPERILFGLLDVAGRREDNQAILSAAQETFRGLGASLFAPREANESDAMTELCLALNRSIMEAADGVRSCPAFLGCYHEKLGTLCYSNAGHTSGLLRDRTGIVEIASTGLPLGLFSHATSEAPIVAMQRSAALLLVSRGVVECEGKDDKIVDPEFGLERVKDRLRDDESTSAEEMCSSILRAVGEFMCGSPVIDDATALALIRRS
jgi:serine phosphatase RsbU (regulator of sigma subunit)